MSTFAASWTVDDDMFRVGFTLPLPTGAAPLPTGADPLPTGVAPLPTGAGPAVGRTLVACSVTDASAAAVLFP